MNPFEVHGFQVEGFCQKDSFYVRFDKEDMQCILDYAKDLGYVLDDITEENPLTVKVIKGERYGWIRKSVKCIDGEIKEDYLYGFFRTVIEEGIKKSKFIYKYPITFNLRHYLRKRTLLACKNFDDSRYPNPAKLVYGILDLEPHFS